MSFNYVLTIKQKSINESAIKICNGSLIVIRHLQILALNNP